MITWHEIIVVGDERLLRAFVAGFLAGRGSDEPVLFGRDLDVQSSTFTDRLRDLFRAGSHHVLLAPARLAAVLAAALADARGDTGICVEHHHVVDAASLPFTVEAFSHEVAARVRADLRDALPPGVILEGFTEQEIRNREAGRAELYAPAHGFTFRASGRFAGPLPGILEMHRRATQLEFVHPGPVTLETRELTGS